MQSTYKKIDRINDMMPFIVASIIFLCFADISARNIAKAFAFVLLFFCVYFFIKKVQVRNAAVVFSLLICLGILMTFSPFDICFLASNNSQIRILKIVCGYHSSEYRELVNTGKIENVDFIVYKWMRYNKPTHALVIFVSLPGK